MTRTGNTNVAPDLVGKQLAIMKEIIPAMTRIVELKHSASPSSALITPQVQSAAKILGIESISIDFLDGVDFSAQFYRVVAAAPQAAYIPADAYFAPISDLLADLQVKNKIPLLAPSTSQPRALVDYGPSSTVLARMTGPYVDAILKGAIPADLPVEQPTVFDLALNLTTARALGITIPPSVLAQATQVVQ